LRQKPKGKSSTVPPLSDKEKISAWNEIRKMSFPIPSEFKEAGWRIIHSPDGSLCQLDTNNGWRVWMGNGIDEKRSMGSGAIHMHGKCLVLGLGIGLISQYIDAIGHCKSMTIIEKSPIVIKHVGPWLESVTKIPIEIIESDDEDFLENTTRKWDTMFADTWERCVDALEKIERLKVLSKNKVRGKKIYWAEHYLRNEEQKCRY
jgi:hypothetical protein